MSYSLIITLVTGSIKHDVVIVSFFMCCMQVSGRGHKGRRDDWCGTPYVMDHDIIYATTCTILLDLIS